jgi:hypothetical protein
MGQVCTRNILQLTGLDHHADVGGVQEGSEASGAAPAPGWSLRQLSEDTRSAEIREVFKEHNRLKELADSLARYTRQWEAGAPGVAKEATTSSGESWWCTYQIGTTPLGKHGFRPLPPPVSGIAKKSLPTMTPPFRFAFSNRRTHSPGQSREVVCHEDTFDRKFACAHCELVAA